jgi:hypothetical protein
VHGNVPWLSFVAFYAVLANIPYWFAAREFGFSPLGWFCVQYVVVGLVALVVPRFVSASLLLAIIFADLMCGICRSYNLPIQATLQNISAADAFTGTRLAYAAATILLAVLGAVISLFLSGNALAKNQRRRAAVCLLAFGLFIVGTDTFSIHLATGHLPDFVRLTTGADGVDLRMSHMPKLARIPVIRLVRMVVAEHAIRVAEKIDGASVAAVPSAMEVGLRNAGILSDRKNGESPNLVLVVVESWGLARDSQLKEAMVQPYREPDLLARYEVIQGSVPFDGMTIPGEARELCGSSFGYHLLNATASELKGCLPDRLAARGYYDIALHGMNGHMFNRSEWYRTIGFQETWFHEGLKQQGMPDCMGALIGTCDADVAAWIGRRLEEDSPQPYFIHWMTLNSHLPVFVPSTLSHGAPCLADLSLTPNTPLCPWYQLIANVHQSVSQIAMGKLDRPTVFIIVGDHAPPFGDPALRNKFSQSDVPYVVLLPRGDHFPSNALLARNAANLHP